MIKNRNISLVFLFVTCAVRAIGGIISCNLSKTFLNILTKVVTFVVVTEASIIAKLKTIHTHVVRKDMLINA